MEQTEQPYEPTVTDVFDVRDMMIKSLGLPLELIEAIIDAAEYWPHTTAVCDFTATPDGPLFVRSGRNNEDVFLVRQPCPFAVLDTTRHAD
jgi:hypothetical protein